ncbi:MAG: hypothetical protein NTX57_04395 [Armatimonadetes bacterium]|nr:hypothetical protein [Armatimonadota bacterium]
MSTVSSLDERTRAHQIYEEQLRAFLEPKHLGKVIAIHPGTGEYVIGETRKAAGMALWERFKDGSIVVFRIGPPTDDDIRMFYRLEAEKQISQHERPQ